MFLFFLSFFFFFQNISSKLETKVLVIYIKINFCVIVVPNDSLLLIISNLKY